MQPLLDPTKISSFLFYDQTDRKGINLQWTVIRKDNQSGCLAGMKAFVGDVVLLIMTVHVAVTEQTSMNRSSNFCIQFFRV